MARHALGYLFLLAPPLLLVGSAGPEMPALALVVMIVVSPLMRGIFGDTRGTAPEWSERIATLLEWLPVVCAAAYVGATVVVAWRLRQLDLPGGTLAWFAGSLWAAYVFGACVAHELVHRSAPFPRAAGRVLSGLIGYPVLEHEHRAHHHRSGSTQDAECARVDESVWGFTVRRLARVFPTAWEGDKLLAIRRGHRLAGGLPLSVASMLATALAFAWAAGWPGLAVYAGVAAAVSWALQAITYIQHWGLGSERTGGAAADLGWEDPCQMQAWLTLGFSFHQAHHQAGKVPYYRLRPIADSPKAPAGYVLLFFVSLVPPLWRMLMVPALQRWEREPLAQPTAGRRLVC